MSRIRELAESLERAHRDKIAASLPADLTSEEAYRLQDLVFNALGRGQRAEAWKVGSPSVAIAPTLAQILPGRLYRSGASISPKGFRIIGVEIEVAFRLGDGDKPEEALVAIEVCDTRLADWDTAPALAKLADFQSNAALVVGSGSSRWETIDFAQQRAELWVDGRLLKAATGAHPYGNPARLLPWAVTHCASRGGLRRGDVVTTGSWTGMDFVQPGAEVRAVFPGLGEAVVNLRD